MYNIGENVYLYLGSSFDEEYCFKNENYNFDKNSFGFVVKAESYDDYGFNMNPPIKEYRFEIMTLNGIRKVDTALWETTQIISIRKLEEKYPHLRKSLAEKYKEWTKSIKQ